MHHHSTEHGATPAPPPGHRRRGAAALLATALALPLAAQQPENPPPWWGVQDEVTVSLTWNFDTQFSPGQLPTLQPSFQVVPNWYANPQPFTTSGTPLQWQANLGGHQGVLALVGTNPASNLQATLGCFVDNDPHLDWVKIFWFQFDAFEGTSGAIEQEIQEQLNKFGRATVTVTTAPLAGGWEQVTVSAELIPQPDDEQIDFAFLQTSTAMTAIDNLHVSSRCVKPRPDEDGEALGEVVSTTTVDLSTTTGLTCRAVAATRGGATQPRRYWVAAVAPTATSPHVLLEVDATGTPLGNQTPLPATPVNAPLGPLDLTVERQRLATGGIAERVYVLLRDSNGDLAIRAFDPTGAGALLPAFDTTIPAQAAPLTSNGRLGLAFDPDGDNGAGSFWVSGRENVTQLRWRAFEFSRSGALLDAFDVPIDTFGFDYDATLGNFYCFSRQAVQRPGGGLVGVVGVEISGYSHEPTGVTFLGDLNVPNPGGPPGGLAAGMTVVRTFGGVRDELRFLCVAEAAGAQFFYELGGPFRYGYSRFGTIGMENGPPFVGGTFDVTLRGVPNTLLALLYLGSSDAILPIGSGIRPEMIASITPTVSTAPLAPVSPGAFAATIAVPSAAALGYADVYFQWVVLDTTAQGFVGLSQAGKTVLYP